MLQHDNARPHTARATQNKIMSFNWKVLPHPPYSSDIAPPDYHLFRWLQNHLCDKIYENDDQLKYNLNLFFPQKTEKFFAEGIKKLVDRWLENAKK